MNDLATVAGNLPAHLQQHQDNGALAEFSAGVQSGAVLPFLSIRGKEFRFRWQGQERSTRARELEVLMLAARPNVSRRYFATGYTPGSIEAPDCSSTNGSVPDADVKDRQCHSCTICPHNQFGSKITASGKRGKACNDFKRIIVLPLLDGQMMDTPVILDVPATSLKAVQGYRGQELFMREYLALMAKHNVPPYGVVTKVSFTDSEYPQISFALSRYTSEGEYTAATNWREHDDVQEALAMPEAEAPGPISEAPAAPAPAPQPAPAPAPAEATPQWAPQEAAPVQQRAPAPAPVAAPAPAPQPAPAPVQAAAPAPAPAPSQPADPAAAPQADADVMDEVRKMLGSL